MFRCRCITVRDKVWRDSRSGKERWVSKYTIISKQSQKRHVRGRWLRERAKEREIENVYTSVFSPSFFLLLFCFLLLEKFTLVVVRVSSQKFSSPPKEEREALFLPQTRALQSWSEHTHKSAKHAHETLVWTERESYKEHFLVQRITSYIFFHE